MSDDQQPILPAVAFFQSPVAVRLTAGVITGGLGIVGHFTPKVLPLIPTAAEVVSFVSDIFALAAMVFMALALQKRVVSPTQPLTLTSGMADARNASNPPMISVDPTKSEGTKP